MRKGPAAALAAVVLIALTLLNTYFILRGKGENSQRAAENHALAVNNCRNIAIVARIERAFIARQEAQSRGLLEHGVTFGIPRFLLPKLLAESRRSQAQFLRELDTLTVLNCAPGRYAVSGLALEGVRPGKEPLGLAGAAA